ncbi:transcriptional regulator, LacI family [Palleronia salina]|uniref:Transcriptional regulator, LacI family n=1 Tax=Palleronia salina TaxID=313368 RepID=A0A1M6KLQ1_9RHOB|nr:LacI family DNA-binding transcriptional regulator [Palleronia salina]SHJ59840.1 transcriptional regulator, LacI family [Palleronia salina]
MPKGSGAGGERPRLRTMEELSVAIGVSRPTLSRYFQDPDSVSRSSRERIARGLERVEYVPNFFATRMNRKSTGMIGVIIPYLNDLFFTKLQQSIEFAAMEAGFTVIVQCSHTTPEVEARAVETLISMNVDGAIVAPLGDNSDIAAMERLNRRLPFVLVDSRPGALSHVDYIGTEHSQSMGLMTEYLARVGDPPVFLAMPRVNFNALNHERAYLEKMEELGLEPQVVGTEEIEPGAHYEAHGELALGREFAEGRLTDRSIICVNDRVAIGALRAAARFGLDPGARRKGGLRIAGHDDYPLCPFLVPSLTTVGQDVDAIGQAAVARLMKKIRAENSLTDHAVTLFPGVLKLRESA